MNKLDTEQINKIKNIDLMENKMKTYVILFASVEIQL